MPNWLWWFFEPFTKPYLEMNIVDGLRCCLTIAIIVAIAFFIYMVIYSIWRRKR